MGSLLYGDRQAQLLSNILPSILLNTCVVQQLWSATSTLFPQIITEKFDNWLELSKFSSHIGKILLYNLCLLSG